MPLQTISCEQPTNSNTNKQRKQKQETTTTTNIDTREEKNNKIS